jgi:hypothetical protein
MPYLTFNVMLFGSKRMLYHNSSLSFTEDLSYALFTFAIFNYSWLMNNVGAFMFFMKMNMGVGYNALMRSLPIPFKLLDEDNYISCY